MPNHHRQNPADHQTGRKAPENSNASQREDWGSEELQRLPAGRSSPPAVHRAKGTTVASRSHVERLPDGTEHRTGVWIGNQKARRDKLDTEQLAALAELGVQWAV